MKRLKNFFHERILNQKLAKKVDKARKIAGLTLIGAFILQVSMGALPSLADQSSGPTGENAPYLETLTQVTNVTQSEDGWKKQNEARPGDVLKYQIWYHNYRDPSSGLTAKDVKVRAYLPSEASNTIVVTGEVSASNANTARDIASTSLVSMQTISYIPGSTIWKHQVNGNWVEQKLSDGVTSAGVNIGNVDPCWEKQGTVTFQVKVSNPGLKVTKKVKIEGESEWKDENTAKPGDNLAYLIRFENIGTTKLTNMIIRDSMPSSTSMSYVNGSTKLYAGSSTVAEAMPDGVIAGGINIGNWNAGSDGYVRFNAKIKSDLSAGTHVFKNVGIAKADGVPEVWDEVKTTVTVNAPEPCKPNFVLSKSAFNETKEKDATSVLANADDVVRYTLTTKNTGDGSGNITIKDDISDILEYATITDLGSGSLSGKEITYGSTNVGAGQTVTKNFKVKIKPFSEWPKSGDETLTNVYGNQITVKLGFFTIGKNKTAFNNTRSVDAITKKASAGDTITYTLVTANTGNDKANDIMVSDDIKDVLEYATVTDMKGGKITNGVISWSAVDINAGTAIKNEFVIKVKKPLPENKQDGKSFDLTMENIYGNDVVVEIEKPLLPPAPIPQVLGAQVESLVKTGANSLLMIVLTMFMFVSSLFLYFREKVLLSGALRRA